MTLFRKPMSVSSVLAWIVAMALLASWGVALISSNLGCSRHWSGPVTVLHTYPTD